MPTLRSGVDEFIENFHENGSYPVNVFAATANNLYGNANNWSRGNVPLATERARIPSGETCVFNGTHTVAPYCLNNEGELKADNTVNTRLTVRHFVNFGLLQLGLPTARIQAGVKCELVFSDDPLDSVPGGYDAAQHGKCLINFGTWRAHGKSKPLFAELAAPVAQGATSLTLVLPEGFTSWSQLGWAQDDSLFLPDTRPFNFQDTGWTPQWEYVTVASIEGNIIHLTAPTAFSHLNLAQWADGTVKRVEVMQLRTNLLIRSVNNSTMLRGHTMCVDDSRYGLSGATFLDTGRTRNELLAPTTNQKGRYGWHVHHNKWGDDVDDCIFTNEDFGAGLFSSQRWGCSYHDTSYWNHRGCFHHGMSGAGCMIGEGGNEYEGLVANGVAARIGGNGQIDNVLWPEIGFVGTGFHGRSHLVRVKNVRLYNAPQTYSAPVYINNRDVGFVDGFDRPHRIYVPTVNGNDVYSPAQRTVIDPKLSPILEIDGVFACSQVDSAVPTFWHIGANELHTFAIPGSVIKNVYGFNTRSTSPIQYEMANVTWDGLWLRDTGGFSWGDYKQVNPRLKDAHLAGNSLLELPAVCHGVFEIDGCDMEEGSSIALHPWSDIVMGSKMMGPDAAPLVCNITLNNLHGPAAGLHTKYESRTQIYANGGTGNPYLDTPTGGFGEYNMIAGQIINVTNFGGIPGNNFRVWHNGQARGALNPYILMTDSPTSGHPVRQWGVGNPWWEQQGGYATPNATNEQTAADPLYGGVYGTCLGSLMPADAVVHPNVTGGKVVITGQLMDDGDVGFAASAGFSAFPGDGFGGDVQFAASPSNQIIDDGDAEFAASLGFASFPGDGYGGDVMYAAPALPPPPPYEEATWTFPGLEAGPYLVSVTWTPHANRATNAPFTVYDGATPLFTEPVNQEAAPGDFTEQGVMWHRLNGGAPVTLTAGNDLVVKLTNNADEFVIADAVLVQRQPQDEASWTFAVAPGAYKVSVTWAEHPNRATNAPFTVLDGTTPLFTELVNQELAPADFTEHGVGWKRLNGGATVAIAGTSLVIKLANDANEYVIADAVKIERVL